jgi:hypothetical protein
VWFSRQSSCSAEYPPKKAVEISRIEQNQQSIASYQVGLVI